MSKTTPKPKSDRLIRSPLCIRLPHCGTKAILGPREPWSDGRGYQRRIWCCRCDATGVQSCNTADERGKAKGIVIAPPPHRRPRVWHVNDPQCPPDAVYVGRPTKWGNPYRIGRDGTREAVIAKHRASLIGRPSSDFAELRGKDLSCWCWPQPCHASHYLDVANR